MDPNLENIRETNMYAITHGKIQQAILQAEDYLTYINGHDKARIQEELSAFVDCIKQIRRKSRGQKRKI